VRGSALAARPALPPLTLPGAEGCSAAKSGWWVQVFGVDVKENLLDPGQGSFEGALRSLGHLAVQGVLQGVDLLHCQSPLVEQAGSRSQEGIAQEVGVTLGLGAIELLVVRQRVRVWPHAVAVDKGRTQACAAVCNRGLEGAQTGLRVGAVHLGKVKVRKVGHEAGDVAARRIHLHRSADGVAVVLHAEDDRQFF